ncbi:unnamed protein product [Dicrocoelium dendriticum]|nr:unnamed protein product [Dicrocoelium dendriticum]
MSVRTSSDSSTSFDWEEYLLKTSGRPAEQKCFKQSPVPPVNLFEVNTLLEAEDQRSAALDLQTSSPSASSVPSLSLAGPNRRVSQISNPPGNVRRFRAAAFTLAQVVEVWGARLRIRLVGTDDRNDCWFLVDSDQIRPYPSFEPLQPPFGYMHNHLHWSRTVKSATANAKFADPSWFVKPPPDPADNYFQVGDKLEAVDRRNTQLICPASVGAVNGQHILVSFDGWSGAFDYWTRFDSRELFPVGWCKKADYPLQPPGPNALRSPASHSTPGPGSGIRKSSHHPTLLSLNAPSSGGTPLVPITISDNRARNRTLSRSNHRRSKSYTTKRARLLARKSASIRNAHRTNRLTSSWQSNSHMNGSGPHDLNESTDSSNRSLSLPPLIHPVSDDPPLNISGSSADHPPAIEAALPLPCDVPSGHRTSGSSDCVVRLQARSPPDPSGHTQYARPELKSWQVVSSVAPLHLKPKKTKASKRHRHSVDANPGLLRKKYKLISETPDRLAIVATKDDEDSDLIYRSINGGYPRDSKGIRCGSTAEYKSEEVETNPTDPAGITCSSKHSSSHHSKSTKSSHTPLQLYCDEFHAGGTTTNLSTKPSKYTTAHPDSVSPMDPTDDELVGGGGTTKFVNGSMLNNCWYPPNQAEHISAKVLDNYSTSQVADEYLDGQSLAAHVSSSTVSPSSLDLGPGPLPNPSYWTIDEVCHYLTTRDSTLSEVAQKFKHHEIDGQALLLLNMESLRNYLQIKLGPALKIDHLITRLKRGLL